MRKFTMILVTAVAVAAILGISAGPANADAVIYEPFDMPAGALPGQAGGTGLGTWSGDGGVVASGSMTFGSLPASGNRYTGAGGYYESWAGFSTTLSSAGLLDHSAELWFSAVLQPGSSSNDYGFIGLSSATGNIGANFGSVPTVANIMGIWLQNGSDLQLVNAVGGTPVGGRNKVKENLSLLSPTLVVGKFTWGADGASNDTLEIYLPWGGLAQPAPQTTTMTTVIDQSTFSYLGVWMRNVDSQVDEIRFGATYDDVIGVMGPGIVAGDADENGVVDAADYIALKTHIGTATGAVLANGDFDVDGDVDWDDLQILQDNFGKTSAGGAVPEPATIFVMLAAGLPALLKRRRRA